MKRLTPRSLWTCSLFVAVLTALSAGPALGQVPADAPAPQAKPDAKLEAFNASANEIQQRLVESQAELDALIKQIAQEKAPLNAELRELEIQLSETRRELDRLSRQAAVQALEEEKLKQTIAEREKNARSIFNQFDEYIREFEVGLHIAEQQRYQEVLEPAKLAMDNRELTSRSRFAMQSDAINASVDRLEELQGGVIYKGSAIDGRGVLGTRGAVVVGTFVQFGPVVVFSDSTGKLQGLAVPKIGATLAEIVPFNMPEDAAAVRALAESGKGDLPLDPTLGDAIVAEQVEEGTLIDEFYAGGVVMYPLLVIAALVALIGLYKWLAIMLTPSPSRKKLAELLKAVADRNPSAAHTIAKAIRGPSGRMLQAGAEHMDEPRELIEEVMYEHVLKTRLKVQRLLPFIAICAAAAPLLGLLGTVSGIINTFKMMQVSGAADMQNVSGGISEALITTKWGLIVAIPSLILHVFLSRKARGVIDQMEKSGVAFISQVMKSPPGDGEHRSANKLPSPDGDTPPSEPEPEDQRDLAAADDAEDAEDNMDDTQILPAEKVKEDEEVLV